MRPDIITVANLVKQFTLPRTFRSALRIRAVNNVSFSISRGETFGLVGESGSGKSTLGRTILRLYEPDAGTIQYNGADITKLQGQRLAPYRQQMQMILQDPYSALNPAMQVRDIIAEPLGLREKRSPAEQDELVKLMLKEVGLQERDLHKYPHEFSGGQRQRIGIARALIVHPEFVLCDEPISALDVSIQAQVVNLLEDLQQEYGLTYLFVAHDLSMARYISHRIAVMYRGELVEIAESKELYGHPLHPYTQMLLASILIPDPKQSRTRPLLAEAVEAADASGTSPQGCAFFLRCPRRAPSCREESPGLAVIGKDHSVACFRAGD
ncbi:MAG: ABC transporter ATP-binding protein [Treponema sp.]|jgi:oligopeptide/dipeptide ABC transporter ATP-binding protein|nr:ABC transporter ATP-binding protein [Treponema sp.]